MKVGIIQQHNNANIDDNRNRLASKVTALAAQGAELVALQELHDSLYFCQTEDVSLFDLAVKIPGEITEFYSELAKSAMWCLSLPFLKSEQLDSIITPLWCLTKMAQWLGNIAKCTFPTIPHTTRSSTFAPVILVLSPFKLRWANWACWFVGTSGTPKLPA